MEDVASRLRNELEHGKTKRVLSQVHGQAQAALGCAGEATPTSLLRHEPFSQTGDAGRGADCLTREGLRDAEWREREANSPTAENAGVAPWMGAGIRDRNGGGLAAEALQDRHSRNKTEDCRGTRR